MRVLDWEEFISDGGKGEALALTIGVFDGVHRGHAVLIRSIRESAACPTVVTFRQNPLRVLNPRGFTGDIFSLEQKLAAFEALGAAQTVLIDFSADFSTMMGKDFIAALTRNKRVDRIVVGVNFRCGRGLDTGIADIRALAARDGVEVAAVPHLMAGSHPVSSSRIREAVLNGDLARASGLLGRNVELDLSGLPGGVLFREGEERREFDTRLCGRIIPPAGLYRGKADGVETVISIKDGIVCIPGKTDLKNSSVKKLEFVEGIQKCTQ